MTLLAAAAPVQLPVSTTTVLGDGVRVVVARRPGLPLATVELLVEAGAAQDPRGKAGLAAITAELLRRGTRTRSADDIDAAIEFVGGHLDVQTGQDFTTVAATVPSEALPVAFDVLSDMALHPSFEPKEVSYIKNRTLGELAQNLDDPGAVADRSMLLALLGEDHPYGVPVQGFKRTVSTLRRDDVVRFHQSAYTPARTVLLVVGDVDPAEVLALAQKQLGGWKNEGKPLAPVPAPEQPRQNTILVVHKPKATQVQVRFVGLAFPQRTDPQYFPAQVANAILGGGFTSRLVDEIRVNRGLSYGVGTRLSQFRSAGFYTFRSSTRNDTIGELLKVALSVAAKTRESGFNDKELETARRYLSGLYPMQLETNEQISMALAEKLVYGLPDDWVPRYRDHLMAVTLREANAAASRWFFAQPFAIVLVGDKAVIQKAIADAGIQGKVKVVPVQDLE